MEENQDALRLFKLQGSYRKVIGRIDIFHMRRLEKVSRRDDILSETLVHGALRMQTRAQESAG